MNLNANITKPLFITTVIQRLETEYEVTFSEDRINEWYDLLKTRYQRELHDATTALMKKYRRCPKIAHYVGNAGVLTRKDKKHNDKGADITPEIVSGTEDALDIWADTLTYLNENNQRGLVTCWLRCVTGIHIAPDAVTLTFTTAFKAQHVEQHYRRRLIHALKASGAPCDTLKTTGGTV